MALHTNLRTADVLAVDVADVVDNTEEEEVVEAAEIEVLAVAVVDKVKAVDNHLVEQTYQSTVTPTERVGIPAGIATHHKKVINGMLPLPTKWEVRLIIANDSSGAVVV